MKKKRRTRRNGDGLEAMSEGAALIEQGLQELRAARGGGQRQGLSLHIGVNKLNPKCYPLDPDDPDSGWEGPLAACERDAIDMTRIAKSQGFDTTTLLTADAIVDNVVTAMEDAAKRLEAGDMFLLTFAGHGGQVPDISGDEAAFDNADETWCLYDRQFLDDELYIMFSKFKAGVRVLVFSDSCHSGTVTRAIPNVDRKLTPAENKLIFGTEKPVTRLMPRETAMTVYFAREEFYDNIQNNLPTVGPDDVKASIRLISACQDDEEAADGIKNGKFTGVVKRVWANGDFEGDYVEFHSKIRHVFEKEYEAVLQSRQAGDLSEIYTQMPNYKAEGLDDDEFDYERPFSI